jgi:hypothetical protein
MKLDGSLCEVSAVNPQTVVPLSLPHVGGRTAAKSRLDGLTDAIIYRTRRGKTNEVHS